MSADLIPRPSATQRPAAEVLRQHIREIVVRAKWITTVDAITWSLVGFVVALAVVAWLDIIWQLPFAVRQWIVPLGLVTLIVGIAAQLIRRFADLRDDGIAKRLDALSRSGGQILSGWDLLDDPKRSPADGVTGTQTANQTALARGIASVAIDQAATRAVAVPSRLAAPWTAARRGGLAALGLVMVAGLASWIAPHALATSWKRLVAPDISTPPYSPLVFDVSPGDTRCNYGSPIEITAVISGGIVEDANLVLGSADDPTAASVAMFPRGGGTWQAVVPRLTVSTNYHITAGRGRSATYRIEVMQVPTIESLAFTITPPSYTGIPERKGRHPQDRIAGLATTQVTLHVQADRPLSGGGVSIKSSDSGDVGDLSDSVDAAASSSVTLQVDPNEPQSVSGTVTITRSGHWTVTVIGDNDIETESPITLDVTLLADRPPIARIVQPQAKSYATADTTVPVSIVAEDDFGVDRLQLYRMIDGSPASPLEFDLSGGGAAAASRTVQETCPLPLSALGLQPGDRITLFARSEDNRPDVVQGGESPITEIEIISQADFDRVIAARQGRQMIENKFRQADRMLEQLASAAEDLQDQLANADPKDTAEQERLQKQIDELRQKMNDVAEELEKLAAKELPLDLDKSWNEILKQQATALRQACDAADQCKQDGKSPQEQADELQKQLDQMRKKQDRAINEPMEALRKIAPLLASESQFVALVARQRSVVEQLDRLRKLNPIPDAADRELATQLRAEEAAIATAVDQLLQDIQGHAERLGDDPETAELKASTLQFVQDVRQSPIDGELASARESLAQLNGDGGYSHAERALTEMEKFLSQCESNSESAGQCLKKKFAPGMSSGASNRSLSQMLSQMGLQPGSGDGYSMRGNSGQNVGLYGNQPFAQPAGGGNGDNGRMMPAGSDASRLGAAQSDASAGDAWMPDSVQGGSTDVPLRYRKQAEDYLRRLAEQGDF